jgi:hypothetical protein
MLTDKLRFVLVLFVIPFGVYCYLNREFTEIQHIFSGCFFLINIYVFLYSFIAVFLEGERRLLEYATLSLIILLNTLALYTGYFNWVVAYTAVFWFAFGVVPFSVTLFVGLVRKYKRKRR